MKIVIGLLCTLIMLSACSGGESEQVEDVSATQDIITVGTFDSRAVALAYYRSEKFFSEIEELRAAYDEAVETGNEAEASRLEMMGSSQQELAHERCFSTGPVDDILWMITEELPDIAARVDVDVIVSSWDVVFQADGVEFVDVTDMMVNLFDPTEETLGIIQEMKNVPPIPPQLMPVDEGDPTD